MSDYDPQWDMPEANWLQQGSFEGGEIPIVVSPDAGTQICIGPVAEEWVELILGCLDQLRNPSTWIAANDAAMEAVLRKVDLLREIIATKRVCQLPTQARLQGCVLQLSNDGGTTWTDATGWSGNFCGCVTDCVPAPPPGPPGVTPDQRACNISGYLATNVIQTAITQAVANYNASLDLLHWAISFGVGIFGVALPITALGLAAMEILFEAITAGTIADFNAASTDASLFNKVKCCIYLAIRSDGQVTDTNFASIVSCLGSISYAHPEVVTAIHDYVNKLGPANLRALQGTGVFASYNCEDCTPWCVRWGSVSGDRPLSEWDAVSGFGSFSGVFWASVVSGGDQRLQIELNTPSAGHITGCEVKGSVNGGSVASDRSMEFLPGPFNCYLPTGSVGSFDTTCTLNVPGCTYMAVALFTRADTVPPPNTITSILVRGIGVNPWGTSNC